MVLENRKKNRFAEANDGQSKSLKNPQNMQERS